MEGFNNGKQLKHMVRRYVKGRATPQESDFLGEWDRYLDSHHDAFADLPQQERDTIRDTMLNELKLAIHAPKPRKNVLYRWLPYAAAVLFVASVVAYIAVVSRQSSVEALRAGDIPPGGNRATLTLADGRTISLSEAQAGIVVADGVTYLDGSSVLHGQGNGGTAEPGQAAGGDHGFASAQVHTLTTPKGGTYQVTLADGSRVWLNAGSTLRYPSRFDDGSREVFLEGEAYFDIREQADRRTNGRKAPFCVVTGSQAVEVLGTEFNVSAYADDRETKTTLLEGRVQIVNCESGAVNQLRPGQQATTRNAATVVRNVDTEQYTSWKSGLFYFRDADIDAVVKQLERWYDVQVVYAGAKPTNQFTGEIPRDRNASEVLAMLEFFGVSYRIDGKKITLSNNQTE